MTKEDSSHREEKVQEILLPLLEVRDVAEILGLAAKTVNKLVREGKLGCVHVTS
jgi:hypothetical protein